MPKHFMMPLDDKQSSNSLAIEVRNLTVSYNSAEPVLKNLSFKIEAGTITAIIGPNGAGKTTLIKAILGLIPIDEGEIFIFGKSKKETCRHLRGHHFNCFFHPGYVPQRYSFDKTFPITVNEFLELALPQGVSKEKINLALEEIGMFSAKNKLLGALSGGQIQRVLIARAILGEPRIIFLDEPSFGIDIAGEKTFYELIRYLNEKYKSTCILVSHEIDIVFQYAHQVICLNKQLVCQGKPELVLSAETLKKVYGEEITLYKHQFE
jgi:ABC-type Mn2+/Zn2+ transport system ATPase subunit